jgi:hypothetical protein
VVPPDRQTLRADRLLFVWVYQLDPVPDALSPERGRSRRSVRAGDHPDKVRRS